MKIKETIERECCQRQDLLMMRCPINGRGDQYWFCKYCGRHWEWVPDKEPGDGGTTPLPWPWEAK